MKCKKCGYCDQEDKLEKEFKKDQEDSDDLDLDMKSSLIGEMLESITSKPSIVIIKKKKHEDD